MSDHSKVAQKGKGRWRDLTAFPNEIRGNGEQMLEQVTPAPMKLVRG
jgi:hypothetical protein